jgi:hypothetical protein
MMRSDIYRAAEEPHPGTIGPWVAPTAAAALLGFVTVMVLS